MVLTKEVAMRLAKKFNVNLKKTPFAEFYYGLKTEMEHKDVIGDNKYVLTRIVKAHLEENPRYYYYLKKAGL